VARAGVEESDESPGDDKVSVPATARPAGPGKLDHAPDYSWVQGRLEYSALAGGIWKVRYAPLSVDDEYGGSVILETPPNAEKFRVGDLVYVEGRIVTRSARGPLPNPIFRTELMSKAGD
jgi:hypothetical protein